VAAAAASCTTTLAGLWRLTGDVVENGCNATAPLESELEITQNGTSLTARGTIQPHGGTIRSDGWQLSNVFVELGACPTGEPAEALWLIGGTLPGADGVVAVVQTIGWSSPVAPFFPCPACTVRWHGTMRRE
jgi:hypothetical protein